MFNRISSISTLREYIEEYVSRVASSNELRAKYFSNPEKDFTRNRKLPFPSLVMYMLSRSTGTLDHTLMDFFGYGGERPGRAALVKAMSKVNTMFWGDLFSNITAATIGSMSSRGKATYKGYRLLAIDGTDLALPETDDECHTSRMVSHGQVSTYYSLHINCLYDILLDSIVDAVIQKGDDQDEQAACLEMVDRNHLDRMILICDRGYPNYNLIAHMIRNGQHFLFRSQNAEGSIGGYWWEKLSGGMNTGSINVKVRITRIWSKAVKASPAYHSITKTTKFDFIPEKSPFKQGRKGTTLEDIPEGYCYEISFRVVRVRIGNEGDENEYETLVTNLPETEFSEKDLKHLYHARWSQETSYRELKHDEGLMYLHSKKTQSIIAEVYLAMIMHNITALASLLAFLGLKRRNKGHSIKGRDLDMYYVNHSNAAKALRLFLREPRSRPSPDRLMKELVRSLVAIKAERSFPRILRLRGFVGYSYRAS